MSPGKSKESTLKKTEVETVNYKMDPISFIIANTIKIGITPSNTYVQVTPQSNQAGQYVTKEMLKKALDAYHENIRKHCKNYSTGPLPVKLITTDQTSSPHPNHH